MNLEKIGKFIAQRRKEKGLTQAGLAEILGVSDKAVSKWERGLCLMDISLLIPLSEALNVTVNDIITGEKLGQNDTHNLNTSTVEGIISYQKKTKKKILTILGILYFIIVIPCLVYAIVQIFNIPIPSPASLKDIKTAHKFYDALYEKDLEELKDLVTNPYNPNELLVKAPFSASFELLSPDEFVDNIQKFYDEGGEFISFKGQRQKGIFNSLEMNYELCAKLNNEKGYINIFVEDFNGHAYFTSSALWDPTSETLTGRLVKIFNPYLFTEE